MAKKNLISLFAGAGGLDLGLEMAGFTTKVANELESHACETLRQNKRINRLDTNGLANFIQCALRQKCYAANTDKEKQALFSRLKQRNNGKFLQEAEIIEGDIRNVSSQQFIDALHGEEIFCIAGGPPCQPFSKAGKQETLDCAKNGDLFFEFVRVVKDLRPKWFIFENVKGLSFAKTDVLYSLCKECDNRVIAPFDVRRIYRDGKVKAVPCEACRSTNTIGIVRNETGGSLKIIFNELQKLGYLCEYHILNAADFGAPQIRERLFIIGSREGKRIDWPQPTHVKQELASGQMQLFDTDESAAKPWVTMFEALWQQGHPEYGNIDKNSAVLWVKNVVRPHDEPVTWNLNRPSPTIGAHQGAKLAIAPFGVPDQQIFRQQWHTKGRRQGDTPPVFVEHAYLTDEELLTLQTFPRWWYLHGTRMQRAFQVGNAVPPLLGKVIGEAILTAEGR